MPVSKHPWERKPTPEWYNVKTNLYEKAQHNAVDYMLGKQRDGFKTRFQCRTRDMIGVLFDSGKVAVAGDERVRVQNCLVMTDKGI